MTESVSLAYKFGVAVAGGLVFAACATYVAGLMGDRVPIWFIDVFFWAALTAAVLFVYVTHMRRGSLSRAVDDEPAPSIAARAVTLVPFSVLMPGIVAVLQSTRLQISFHGFFHSAFTYQIINGVVPPENPLLPGHPANDYWLFHALIASLVHSLRIAPPLVAIGVNLIALTVSMFLIAGILGRLRPWPTSPLARGLTMLLVLFGLNLIGVINALVSDPGLTDPRLSHMVVHVGGGRSAGLFGKFLNFNGFPIGIAFFLLGVSSALRLTKRFDTWPLVGFACGLLGALAFHVTTGVFALATLPAALVISILFIRRPSKVSLSRAQVALLGGGIVVGSTLLGHYVLATAAALNNPTQIDPLNATNIARLLLLAAPLIPFFVVGTVHAYRERRRDLLMLSLATVGGVILACVLVVPGGNQYKFDYLSALPMVVVAIAGWRALRNSERASLPKLAVITGVLAAALTIGNQLYIGLAYMNSKFANDSVAYEGPNVVGGRAGARAEAWEWLRDNSPTDAIVVLPLASKDDAGVLAISQRLPYVLRGSIYTAGYPDFEDRADRLRDLYSARTSLTVKRQIIGDIAMDVGNRPLFIAVVRAEGAAVNSDVADLEHVFTSALIDLFRLET
jgi:hypothetical protein